jgi:hypothetical protein
MKVFRLFPDTMTSAISHLPIMRRIQARRRVEAIADHWALFLKARYGNHAVGRCRQKMAACSRYSAGMRWQIWTKVYSRLHPPELRRDQEKAR